MASSHYLWRAADQDGNVLDILVTSRRDATAATRFFRKLLRGLLSWPPGFGERGGYHQHVECPSSPAVAGPAEAGDIWLALSLFLAGDWVLSEEQSLLGLLPGDLVVWDRARSMTLALPTSLSTHTGASAAYWACAATSSCPAHAVAATITASRNPSS